MTLSYWHWPRVTRGNGIRKVAFLSRKSVASLMVIKSASHTMERDYHLKLRYLLWFQIINHNVISNMQIKNPVCLESSGQALLHSIQLLMTDYCKPPHMPSNEYGLVLNISWALWYGKRPRSFALTSRSVLSDIVRSIFHFAWYRVSKLFWPLLFIVGVF